MKKIKDKESTIFFLENPPEDAEGNQRLRMHVEGNREELVRIFFTVMVEMPEIEGMIEKSLLFLNRARRDGLIEKLKEDIKTVDVTKEEFYKD